MSKLPSVPVSKEPELTHFRQIFNSMAVDQKAPVPRVTQEKLEKIFEMVDFHPNEILQREISGWFSRQKETEREISYEQFMKLFSLRSNPAVKQADVKNAFRMLCKDYGEKDNLIHKNRIKEILEEIGLDSVEVSSLVAQLETDFTKDGFLNFEDFVDRQYL